MNSKARRALLTVIVVVIAAAAAYWWWNGFHAGGTTAPEPAVVAPPEPTASAAAVTPEVPPIQYPVQAPTSTAPLESSGIAAALRELLGSRTVSAFPEIGDFAHRFVATVDNLGRSYAPASLWPISPTSGRFTVQERDGGTIISADNDLRYTALVLLAESVDPGKAVDLYLRMYPLLQRAYEDLGYPKGYFNDRLIAVIDLLLASPNPGYPVRLQLTQVKGTEPSLQPWVRYEFADPALESLAAGQKIMVRVGPVNERRLKARLVALRKELLTRVVPR